jgi:Na+/H+ antiporter NhaC
VTVVILLIFGRPEAVADMGDLSFNFLKVVPYLVVLILALCGINVFVVLSGGIFLSGIIGMATGSINVFEFAQAIWDGFTGMNEVFFLTLFCAGMAEMITVNGGLAWIIQKLKKMMKGQKSAELGIAALVSLTDLATANNTIAIVVTGKVAKDISSEFDVDPRKSASLLDIFSCVFQGVIPYGAQLLSAAALTNATIDGAGVSSMDFVPYVWYVWVLLVFALVDIFIPYADKTRKAK